MSIEKRFKDREWDLSNPDGSNRIPSWQSVEIAVLMDIRDELKRLNGLLHCGNFIGIPGTLRTISRNTAKPRKKTS